jgi:predicted regulator of Ras-like GTPase activity (Roadblock/LC7/MglB family)
MPEKTEGALRLRPARCLAALLSFAAVSAAVLFCFSALIAGEKLPDDIGKAYIVAALVAGAAVSSAVLASGLKSGKALAIVINAVLAEALLLALGLTLGQGSLSGRAAVFQILCVLAGSITGCILSAHKRPRRRGR